MPNAEIDAVVEAARSLLQTASRPTLHSATAQVNASALDQLRAAVARVIPPVVGEDPMTDSADKDALCKHCGRPIRNGMHAAGRQHGLQRCDSRDSGLRYGYNAETADEPCSIACLGSVTPSAATKDPS